MPFNRLGFNNTGFNVGKRRQRIYGSYPLRKEELIDWQKISREQQLAVLRKELRPERDAKAARLREQRRENQAAKRIAALNDQIRALNEAANLAESALIANAKAEEAARLQALLEQTIAEDKRIRRLQANQMAQTQLQRMQEDEFLLMLAY